MNDVQEAYCLLCDRDVEDVAQHLRQHMGAWYCHSCGCIHGHESVVCPDSMNYSKIGLGGRRT